MLLTLVDIRVSAIDYRQDEMMWQEVFNGNFFVTKACEMMAAISSNARWPGWKRIWKLKLQQWLKTFLWLMAHDILIINQITWRQQIAESQMCLLCEATEESNLHTVHDCPEARKVWAYFVPSELFE